jgi:hypothetical protein
MGDGRAGDLSFDIAAFELLDQAALDAVEIQREISGDVGPAVACHTRIPPG